MFFRKLKAKHFNNLSEKDIVNKLLGNNNFKKWLEKEWMTPYIYPHIDQYITKEIAHDLFCGNDIRLNDYVMSA